MCSLSLPLYHPCGICQSSMWSCSESYIINIKWYQWILTWCLWPGLVTRLAAVGRVFPWRFFAPQAALQIEAQYSETCLSQIDPRNGWIRSSQMLALSDKIYLLLMLSWCSSYWLGYSFPFLLIPFSSKGVLWNSTCHQGCIFFPKIGFFIKCYLRVLSFL